MSPYVCVRAKTKQSRVSRCVPLVATMAASGPVLEAPDTAISLERTGSG